MNNTEAEIKDNTNYQREYIESLIFGHLYYRKFKNVSTYCMFLGYPRSGHSLIGAVLSAHKNALIAHELDALRFITKGFSKKQLFYLLYKKDIEFTRSGCMESGYSYHIPNQWQSKSDKLCVIGDKKGGGSSMLLNQDPDLLEKLKNELNIPIKIIHIVRNPFDVISGVNLWYPRPLIYTINYFFYLCNANQNVIDSKKYDILTIRHEDFVLSPDKYIKLLCNFLNIECLDDYLEDCKKIIHESKNVNRNKIEWTDKLKHIVLDHIENYDFLKGYSFDV